MLTDWKDDSKSIYDVDSLKKDPSHAFVLASWNAKSLIPTLRCKEQICMEHLFQFLAQL